MGKCEYLLAKDKINNIFEVIEVNEPCGNGQVSCVKSVRLFIPNLATIIVERGKVSVNGTDVTAESYAIEGEHKMVVCLTLLTDPTLITCRRLKYFFLH